MLSTLSPLQLGLFRPGTRFVRQMTWHLLLRVASPNQLRFVPSGVSMIDDIKLPLVWGQCLNAEPAYLGYCVIIKFISIFRHYIIA